MDEGKEIEVVLKIKLKTTMENIPENTEEAVRFLVEDDLEDLGYGIEYVKLIEE